MDNGTSRKTILHTYVRTYVLHEVHETDGQWDIMEDSKLVSTIRTYVYVAITCMNRLHMYIRTTYTYYVRIRT